MKSYCIKFFLITFLLFTGNIILAQTQHQRMEDVIYQSSRRNRDLIMPTGENKYVTSEDGVIRMYVNVWGEVNNPGTHLVYEDINLLTLLSVCGGPSEGANLSKIKVISEKNDSTESEVKILNIENFLKDGTRKDLITLKPNDTIIVPEKVTHLIFSNLNILNTTLHLVTLYFQMEFYRARTD